MDQDKTNEASNPPSTAPACGSYPAADCSVRFVLMGLNTWSVWIEIRPLFATEEDARKEEAEYRRYFRKPKNADYNGWKDFCVVKRTTTEKVCAQNIAVSGGLPATGKTYTGRAGSQLKGNDNGK